ncbi:MAG: hypothetical protein JXQ73_06810 [Phycisphaerae bacterium]|nr:hypothetical protein [Phycisphaerae bacterium]
MAHRTYDLVSLEGISSEDVPTLLSLQGLANRAEPRVYLLPRDEGPEHHWVRWYEDYGLRGKPVPLDQAVASHAGCAKGFIVYDPKQPDTVNVAMCLAGTEDAIVCPPSRVRRLTDLGLKCIDDLTGRWPDKLTAYRWAVDNVMKRCDGSVLANYEHGKTVGPRPTMDFLVARRGFCMGLTVNEADFPVEAALWHRVQSDAPDHAMMLGWHTGSDSEATHVYFGSRHNVWVYCAGAWNMSFHQHVRPHKAYAQSHAESAVCDPSSRYVAITLSDGDSWHSMADVQKKFWLHPRRGEVPIGWEVAPIFATVGPAILEYYFASRAENDYLVCGPSGIGYNYLSGFADWQGFLRHTAEAMQATSLRTIWAINRAVRHRPGGAIEHRLKDGPVCYTKKQMEEFGGIKDQKGADWVDPRMVERYVRGIPQALGFFQGWERIPGEGPRWVDGKCWCPTVALVRSDVDATIREFEQGAEQQPAPAFLAGHVNCYQADMDVVIDVIRRLEAKGYTVVRPDTFLRLAEDARAKGLV